MSNNSWITANMDPEALSTVGDILKGETGKYEYSAADFKKAYPRLEKRFEKQLASLNKKIDKASNLKLTNARAIRKLVWDWGKDYMQNRLKKLRSYNDKITKLGEKALGGYQRINLSGLLNTDDTMAGLNKLFNKIKIKQMKAWDPAIAESFFTFSTTEDKYHNIVMTGDTKLLTMLFSQIGKTGQGAEVIDWLIRNNVTPRKIYNWYAASGHALSNFYADLALTLEEFIEDMNNKTDDELKELFIGPTYNSRLINDDEDGDFL